MGSSAPPAGPVRCYRLYGVMMASDFSFANPLPQVSGPPDMTFSCVRTVPPSLKRKRLERVYPRDDETGVLALEKGEDCHVVRFQESIDFYLFSDAIVAHLIDPDDDYLVEILLLGEIFSIWLELHGILALHASATVVDNQAIAFMTSNKGGKTGLAAAMMQKGHQLLTDDIMPVGDRQDGFFARPGYPAMRMWPDQAAFFLGRWTDLAIVHPAYVKRRVLVGPGAFGTFCPDEMPLKVLYLPERQVSGDDIVIKSVPQRIAFIRMIENSFSAPIVGALGLEGPRMHILASLVARVPLRRLIYPEGFDHLSRVAAAVLEDIASLSR